MSVLLLIITLKMIPVFDEAIYRRVVHYEEAWDGKVISIIANYFDSDNSGVDDSIIHISTAFKTYKDVLGIIKSPDRRIEMDLVVKIDTSKFEINVFHLRSIPLERDRYGKLIANISQASTYSADMQQMMPNGLLRSMELKINEDIQNIKETLSKEKKF